MSRLFIPRRDSRPARTGAHLFVEEDAEPDAAWISWKSGGVVQREIRRAREKIKAYLVGVYTSKYLARPSRVSGLFKFDLKLNFLKISGKRIYL